MADCYLVVTTTARKDEAETIAGELVARRLAACVQISGPITSVFRWQGQVEHSQEWLCFIKTTRGLLDALEAAIRELHPYEVPEFVAIPAERVGAAYQRWLDGELKPSE